MSAESGSIDTTSVGSRSGPPDRRMPAPAATRNAGATRARRDDSRTTRRGFPAGAGSNSTDLQSRRGRGCTAITSAISSSLRPFDGIVTDANPTSSRPRDRRSPASGSRRRRSRSCRRRVRPRTRTGRPRSARPRPGRRRHDTGTRCDAAIARHERLPRTASRRCPSPPAARQPPASCRDAPANDAPCQRRPIELHGASRRLAPAGQVIHGRSVAALTNRPRRPARHRSPQGARCRSVQRPRPPANSRHGRRRRCQAPRHGDPHRRTSPARQRRHRGSRSPPARERCRARRPEPDRASPTARCPAPRCQTHADATGEVRTAAISHDTVGADRPGRSAFG